MKGTNDFGVHDTRELSALLGEASDVVSQGLVRLLMTPSKIPGLLRAHVCALEVSHKSFDQVGPVVDLVGRKTLEPCSCRVCEVQRKVADDDRVVSRAAQLARQAVVVEPELRIRLPRVLGECGGLPKVWGEGSGMDFPAKHTGARRLRRWAPILPATRSGMMANAS